MIPEKLGPLDRLPAWLRHLIVMLAPVVLAEAAKTWLPWFQERYGASLVGGVVVTFLGLVLTALTRQYGVGSRGNKPQAVLP